MKVYVIGDCHTARIHGQHINAHLGDDPWLTSLEDKNSKIIKDTNIELKLWGLAGFKCFDTNFEKHYSENTMSSPPEDAADIPGVMDHVALTFGFKETKDADIIMPWIGYIDCRNYLPKYRNTSEIVKKYVDNVLNFYNTSKVRFIEPFPQFTALGTHNYSEPFDYDEKTKYADEFIECLRIESDRNGLLPPVSQDIVYKAVNYNKLTDYYARTGNMEYHNGTTIDALQSEYNAKVYKNLIEEIKQTVPALSC